MISMVFIRHGATEGNLNKKYIGITDEPLCDEGINQAVNLRKNNFGADHIYTSPMLRARQSAELIFPGKKYIIEEDFKEIDFGIFEGKSAAELSESREYRRWVESMCISDIPEGEALEDFKRRCRERFAEIMKDMQDGSKAAFVVHGGVIMAVLEAFAKPKCGFYDYHTANGEYLLCEFENNEIKICQKD